MGIEQQLGITSPDRTDPPNHGGGWLRHIQYFPYVRMVSYQFEATYDYIYKQISKFSFIDKSAAWFTERVHEFIGYEVKHSATSGQKERYLQQNWKQKILGVTPFSRDVNWVRKAADGKGTVAYFGQELPGKPSDPKIRNMLFARNLLNVVEAFTFAIITTITRSMDKHSILQDFSGVVALEKQQNCSSVGFGDIKQSQNPFVQLTTKKFGQRNLWRYVTDFAFVWGLKTGIVLKTFAYPFEHGLAQEKDAVGELRAALADIRENKLGPLAQSQLELKMIRAAQYMLQYHKAPPLSASESEALQREVLAPLSAAIIAGNSSFAGYCYVLGELTHPEQRVEKAKQRLEWLLAPATGVEAASSPEATSIRTAATTSPTTAPSKQWRQDVPTKLSVAPVDYFAAPEPAGHSR